MKIIFLLIIKIYTFIVDLIFALGKKEKKSIFDPEYDAVCVIQTAIIIMLAITLLMFTYNIEDIQKRNQSTGIVVDKAIANNNKHSSSDKKEKNEDNDNVNGF